MLLHAEAADIALHLLKAFLEDNVRMEDPDSPSAAGPAALPADAPGDQGTAEPELDPQGQTAGSNSALSNTSALSSWL